MPAPTRAIQLKATQTAKPAAEPSAGRGRPTVRRRVCAPFIHAFARCLPAHCPLGAMFGELIILPPLPARFDPERQSPPPLSMIIYGTNGKHYATHELPATPCPACRAPNSLQVDLVSRYAHVYWIPFFLIRK
ncbi:MAG: hypothetical protein WKG07_43355 [Hymenobacter sp.]